MIQKNFYVIKASGEQEPFSASKYMESLERADLHTRDIEQVFDSIKPHLYNGMTTKKLYDLTFNAIKKLNLLSHASIYSLRESLRLLGPTGFPFERLVSKLFNKLGYDIKLDQHVQGKCIVHEVDVVAVKNDKTALVEVKFHAGYGYKSNIKIPLYIKARFDDILHVNSSINNYTIITNTKFTLDAIQYGECVNIHLIAWGYPRNNSIDYLIKKYKLYPITVLHSLSSREKKLLIDSNIIICGDLLEKNKIAGLSQAKLIHAQEELTKLC